MTSTFLIIYVYIYITFHNFRRNLAKVLDTGDAFETNPDRKQEKLVAVKTVPLLLLNKFLRKKIQHLKTVFLP